MRKYLKVTTRFIKLAWMINMEYRANMLTWTLVELGWTTMDLVFFAALLSRVQALGTWSFAEVLVLLGLFRLMVIPVWGWMFQSFSQLPQTIFRGNLDMVLTKPVDSQFLVSVREVSFSGLSSLVGGVIFIVLGFSKLGYFPNWYQIVITLLVMAVSVGLIYGMYFSTVALALFVGRLNNIHHVFTHAFDMSRYPAEIFPPLLQRLFTTVVPVSLLLTVPAGVSISRTTPWHILWLVILAILFIALSRWLWHTGLHRYSSASS